MPSEPAILTDRLSLRPLRDEDAAPTAALMRESISRWTGSWRPSNTAEDVLERIDRHRRSEAADRGVMRAIERRDDGALIGWIGVDRLEQQGRGVLGYWLGEPFWGHGYATEAAAALLAHAWGLLGLQVIEAGAQPANGPSIAILRKLGMTPIGERVTFASARGQEETCSYFELRRPPAST